MTVDFGQILAAAEAAFGETVYYYTAATGPFALTGIFNDRYVETKFQDGIAVSETQIVLGITAAQFPVQPVQGQRFLIRSILYVVTDPPESDGMGDLKIKLRAETNTQAVRMRLPPGSL